MLKKYTKEEVTESTLKYFNGDELATNVFITKYCLKDGDGDYLELNPNDMHRRLASEFSKIESKKYNSKTKIQPLSEAEIFNLFKDFKYIIPQGSPMFAIGNDYQLTSTSNCYVLTSPEDSYGAIMHTDEELVQVSKRRGGVGIDLSKLRPKGTPTKNAAKTSTGLISFLERYSNSIREVGQDGRRGAALLSLSVKHKEIREFIESKTDLTKITGANISVKIDDEFMLAVKNDSDYELCFPIDYKEKGIEPKVSEMVKAREIWDLLIKTAHSNAEPGILFWDHHLNYNPSSCYKDYCPVSTNPCVIGKTLVLTNLGWIYIENLQKFKDSNPDLQIVTSNKEHDLTLSSLEWVDITSKQDKIYKTTFSNGEHLLSNGKHKLYRYDYKEVKVEDLEKHVVVYSGRHLVHVENVEVTERLEDVWDLTANPNYNFFSINGYDEVILEQINNSIIEDIEKELSTNDLSEITKLFRRSILSVDCGEIALSELDSCRLISMNLINYVKFPFTDKAFFEAEKYMRHVKIAQRLLDDLIDIESNIIDKIIAKVESDPEDIEYKEKELKLWKKIQKIGNDGRRTGLGLTGLADCIAMLGFKYDSEQSLEQIEKIMRIHRDGAYTSSIEMSEDLGPFVGYDYKAEENNLYIKRFAKDCPELYDRMIMNGRRNVALQTVAPSGSISILAGGTSSGIEPVFMLAYTRRRKLDETSKDIPDFVDKNGDRWKHYEILHNTVNAWKDVVGEKPIEESPWFGSTAADINPIQRVRLQAIVQKYNDQSISSCLVPNTLIKTDKGLFYLDELTDFNLIKEKEFKKNTGNPYKVLNHNGDYVNIDSFYNNGISDILEIKLSNGLRVKATYNEKVLRLNNETEIDEWIRLDELEIGDRIKLKQ